MMECNRDEAIRARDMALRKYAEHNFVTARKFVFKAQQLNPAMEGISQMLVVMDVHSVAQMKVGANEMDWGLAVAVAAFEDKLAVFPTSLSSGSNVVDKRIIYPRERISSTGSSEVSTSGMEKNQLLYSRGSIWSMTFVGMPDDQFTRGKSENHLVLAVLVFRKGVSCNELHILMCNRKERIIQLKARCDLSNVRPWMSTLGLSILDVPAALGYLLLSCAGELLLFDLRQPNNPLPTGVCTFSKNIDEEGRLNSVAASALLELVLRGRDGREVVRSSEC